MNIAAMIKDLIAKAESINDAFFSSETTAFVSYRQSVDANLHKTLFIITVTDKGKSLSWVIIRTFSDVMPATQIENYNNALKKMVEIEKLYGLNKTNSINHEAEKKKEPEIQQKPANTPNQEHEPTVALTETSDETQTNV